MVRHWHEWRGLWLKKITLRHMFDKTVLLIPVYCTIVIWHCLKPFIQYTLLWGRDRSNIINNETISVNIVVTPHERGVSNLRQFDCLFNRWVHRQRKQQSSHHWPFVRGIHRWSSHKGPVTRKAFARHNVVMNYQTRTHTVYPMAYTHHPFVFFWCTNIPFLGESMWFLYPYFTVLLHW